jgi:hypothetical protein
MLNTIIYSVYVLLHTSYYVVLIAQVAVHAVISCVDSYSKLCSAFDVYLRTISSSSSSSSSSINVYSVLLKL